MNCSKVLEELVPESPLLPPVVIKATVEKNKCYPGFKKFHKVPSVNHRWVLFSFHSSPGWVHRRKKSWWTSHRVGALLFFVLEDYFPRISFMAPGMLSGIHLHTCFPRLWAPQGWMMLYFRVWAFHILLVFWKLRSNISCRQSTCGFHESIWQNSC